MNNYRPVSLLPNCGKILERLMFDEMFNFFFIGNKVISPNQFGLKQGDASVNQPLSIAHKIYKTFDEGREVRGILLDISKSFDKI